MQAMHGWAGFAGAWRALLIHIHMLLLMLYARNVGAGVDTVSLGDMVAMQQWSVQGLSSTRTRRQAATDTLRQALGYQTVTGNSSIHSCNE